MRKIIIVVVCLVLLAGAAFAGSVFDKAPWERFTFFPEKIAPDLTCGYTDARGATGYACGGL